MKKRFPLLYIGLILTAIFAAFHFVATVSYFYWIYWWSDVVMHFFAGVCGALTTYAVLFDSGWWELWQKEFPQIWTRVLIALISVMIVGVLWEVFEYANGLTDSVEGYTLDVINDLIADAMGAILVLLVLKRFLKSS